MEEGGKGGLRTSRSASSQVRKRWAVLVGVSEYAAPSLRLHFAHRDVEELWKLLQSDRCGRFIPERTCVLVNKEATTAAITRALRSFLQEAAEEDLVLIYFSGHGASDPKRKEVVYFLTHETDPKDVAGTALPMREIMQSLGENLRAKRVILMMDTCHSAAVEGGKGLATGDPIVLEQYLGNLEKAEEGFAIFTSSETSEQSREDAKWGGGHGLFTHLLLEGLRGKADAKQKGTVTLGGLFDYVVEQSRVLGGAEGQHPRVGARRFDRDFVVAITGGADARDRFYVGRALLEMAIEHNDRGRFRAAARHLGESDDLARLELGLPEARMLAGIARMGAGDLSGACDDLRRAMQDGRRAEKAGRPGCPDAGYYLGIALAAHGASADAAQVLREFAHEHWTSGRAELAESLARRLTPTQAASARGRVFALLIGAGHSVETRLPGANTDVELLGGFLAARFEAEVHSLVDFDAHAAHIADAFEALQGRARAEDAVVVLFSGQAATKHPDTYLIPADAQRPGPAERERGEIPGAIGVRALDRYLGQIPARSKLLILDTDAHPAFIECANRDDCTYTVLFAASPGEHAHEVRFAEKDRQVLAGLVTYSLVQTLSELDATASWGDVMPRLTARVKSRVPKQTPLLVGDLWSPFLGPRTLEVDPVAIIETSLFGDRRALAGPELARRYDDACRRLARSRLGPFPDLHLAYGRALVNTLSFREADQAIRRALAETTLRADDGNGRIVVRPDPRVSPELAWTRALLDFAHRRYDQALESFAGFVSTVDPADGAAWLRELEAEVVVLRGRRPRALVVGVDRYTGPDVPRLTDAVADAMRVRDTLVARCGVLAEDIVLLADPTTAQIREAFGKLMAVARESPVLFYFAGNGTRDDLDGEAILGADARNTDVRDLSLAALVPSSLVALSSIIDADFERYDRARFAPPDLRAREMSREVVGHEPVRHEPIRLGRTTIAARSGHRITGHLLQRLGERDPGSLSWAGLVAGLAPDGARLTAAAADEPVLFDAEGFARAASVLFRARRAPWSNAAIVLGSMIQDGRLDPRELLVDLGTTHELLGDLAGAADALKRALRAADGKHPEASYHLGRVLVQSGKDLARAQSELELAAEAEPDNPAIQYYLGAAIRAFFEKESLEKAKAAFRKYRDAGAPIGHREEVDAFLADQPATR